jgi:hypothetical protein
VDVKGRDLAADPLTFYMTAVREGFDDAGVITAKYPGLSPAFRTLYSGMAGQDLTFAAQDSVSAADFAAWTDSIGFITMKSPASGGYIRLDSEKYRVDTAARSIRFDGSLFRETGAYSFVFHAAGYADKAVSLAVKKAAPEIRGPEAAAVGQDLTFTFDDPDYQDGLSLYAAPAGGEPVMVPSNHLDRVTAGRVTLKASWFALPGCPVTAAGSCDFRFTNNRYEPGSVSVTLDLAAGSPPPVFSDADFTKWYGDAVRYAATAGLFDPIEDDRFGPDEPVTRAVFVLALYRRAAATGAANTESDAPRFLDVPEGTDLSEAVAWAVRVGIVNGVDKERFAPDDPITREQIAAMLWRYAVQSAQGAPASAPRGDLQAFSDVSRIAPWAEEPLVWAVGAGLINGMGNGALAPKGGATRAQAAQLLWKYDQAASGAGPAETGAETGAEQAAPGAEAADPSQTPAAAGRPVP